MAQIGSLVVDLTLKSAEFISDLSKSSQAVARNTAAMQRSMSGLEKSVNAVDKAFKAWLTLRTLRQIERITEASLTFAASLSGPLGDSARKFQNQFEDLQNHFEAGLAIGFLGEIQQGFLTTAKSIENLDTLAVGAGKTLGFIFDAVSVFALQDIPGFIHLISDFGQAILDAVKGPLASMLDWAEKLNDELVGAVNKALQLSGIALRVPTAGETRSLLNIPDTSQAGAANTTSVAKQANAFQLLADATLKARTESEEFWAATIQTTGAGGQLLDINARQVEVYNQLLNPAEAYRAKLEEIAHLEATSGDATEQAAITAQQAFALRVQSAAAFADQWLKVADNVGNALGTMFKDSKAVAIANAVINTAEAITSALKNPPGPPFSYVYAASAAALGAAQIATILSTQPGSSNKPSAALKGGGKVSASAVAGSAARTRSGPTQAVTINIEGDVFGPEHFRKIVAGINGVQRDGTAVLRIA